MKMIGSRKIQKPIVNCRHAQVAGKQLFFVTVRNSSAWTLLVQELKVECQQQFSDHSPDGNSLLDAEDEDVFFGDANKTVTITNSFDSQKTSLQLDCMESHCFQVHLNINADKIIEPQVWIISGQLKWTGVKKSELNTSKVIDPTITSYNLMEITIKRPQLLITACPEASPTCRKRFAMKYTVKNNLTEFTSLRLVWNPNKALQEQKAQESDDYKRSIKNVMNSVICHQPSLPLGCCNVGSTVSGAVAFTLFNPGLYELGQHMKVNLQYSVGSRPQDTHLRRDSLTSIRSMPTDFLPSSGTHSDTNGAPKSMSMSPLSTGGGQRGFARADSMGSLKGSAGIVATPTEPSPSRAANLFSGKQNGSLSAYRPAPFSLQKSHGPDRLSNASLSSLSVSAAITQKQVLKRNCQVYVPSIGPKEWNDDGMIGSMHETELEDDDKQTCDIGDNECEKVIEDVNILIENGHKRHNCQQTEYYDDQSSDCMGEDMNNKIMDGSRAYIEEDSVHQADLQISESGQGLRCKSDVNSEVNRKNNSDKNCEIIIEDNMSEKKDEKSDTSFKKVIMVENNITNR